MEVITCHWDGYCLGQNNFRVFYDEDIGKFLFFPHGTDQMFQRTSIGIQPPMNGLVAQAVMRTPEGRRQYRERLEELCTNVFKVERVTNRMQQLAQRIRPGIAAWSPREAYNFDNAVEFLRGCILQRARFLEYQLSMPPPKPVEFVNDIAKLSGWSQQPGEGNVILDQTTFENRPMLHLQCRGSGVGSWRAPVLLPPGRYLFSGLARARRVVPQTGSQGQRGGGGLRISGGQRNHQLSGNTDWTRLEHEFTVNNANGDVVLVCELRARQGEVWYDTASLVLQRLK